MFASMKAVGVQNQLDGKLTRSETLCKYKYLLYILLFDISWFLYIVILFWISIVASLNEILIYTFPVIEYIALVTRSSF